MAVNIFNKYVFDNNLDSKIEIIDSGEQSKTAKGASDSIGCKVSQIAKSLVVKMDNKYAIFITPGHIRLDLGKVKENYSATEVRMADPDEVKEVTGHSIGGVPPFGHKNKINTYIVDGFDEKLPIYAAAGHISKTFKMSYIDLEKAIKR